MLRTINIGTCISVQGVLVAQRTDGKLVIQVDGKTFVGHPVPSIRAGDVIEIFEREEIQRTLD